MKTREREEARRLRHKEGKSVREIARLLSVSRSSASLWVRDIELTPEQHEALRNNNPIYNAQRAGNAAWSAQRRTVRAQWQKEGCRMAREGDPVHAAGCMLYWAEGDKSRNRVGMSNADPEVLRFFLRFLRTYFDVPNEKVRIHCHLFADHEARQREVEQFWLDCLELGRASLGKSIVNNYSRSSLRKRVNMLPYGTCKMAVGSVQILQSIYGSIQEYGGFERPEWLG